MATRVIVESFQVGIVTYQLERVRCGKPTCRACPHGPYWYAYWWGDHSAWSKGCTHSKYLGKNLPFPKPIRTNIRPLDPG